MDMLMLSVRRTLLDMTNITPSFPINVNLEKNKETDCWEVEIRNFIGEKLVRRVVMRPGVEVEASKNQKDQLELSGNVRTAVQQPIQPMLTSSSRSRTSPKVPPTFSKSARSATRISESSWTVCTCRSAATSLRTRKRFWGVRVSLRAMSIYELLCIICGWRLGV
jgi:hypothetical protein